MIKDLSLSCMVVLKGIQNRKHSIWCWSNPCGVLGEFRMSFSTSPIDVMPGFLVNERELVRCKAHDFSIFIVDAPGVVDKVARGEGDGIWKP